MTCNPKYGGGCIYSQKYIIQYNQIQIYPYTYFPLASSNQNISSSLLPLSLPGCINALYWKPCRQLHLGRAIHVSALWSRHLNHCAMEENMKSHTDNPRIILLGKFLVTTVLNYPWKPIWVLKFINFPIHFVNKISWSFMAEALIKKNTMISEHTFFRTLMFKTIIPSFLCFY